MEVLLFAMMAATLICVAFVLSKLNRIETLLLRSEKKPEKTARPAEPKVRP